MYNVAVAVYVQVDIVNDRGVTPAIPMVNGAALIVVRRLAVAMVIARRVAVSIPIAVAGCSAGHTTGGDNTGRQEGGQAGN